MKLRKASLWIFVVLFWGVVFSQVCQAAPIVVLTQHAGCLDQEEQGVVAFLAAGGYDYVVADVTNLGDYLGAPAQYKLAICRTGSEPVGYKTAAIKNLIGSYLNRGGTLLVQYYGCYLAQYLGQGQVQTYNWLPEVDDAYYYLRPIKGHHILGGLSTWYVPNQPDAAGQMVWQVHSGNYDERYLDVWGSSFWTRVTGWVLYDTYGWPKQTVVSSYDQTWGGATPERRTYNDQPHYGNASGLLMAYKPVGAGKLIGYFVGAFNRHPMANGAATVGEKSRELFANLVEWVFNPPPYNVAMLGSLLLED